MRKRCCSGVNIHKTRSFPGADTGSDHNRVMMAFRAHLKNVGKPTQPRLQFDLKTLTDPDVACVFQATEGGIFAHLPAWGDDEMDKDTMITTYNTAFTDAGSEILRNERRK